MYRCICGAEFDNAFEYYRHIQNCKVYKTGSVKLRRTFIRFMRRRMEGGV